VDSTQKTRVELEIVQTGDAATKLEELASAADKAAAAEQNLASKTGAANSAMGGTGPASGRRNAQLGSGGPPPASSSKPEVQETTMMQRFLQNLAGQGANSQWARTATSAAGGVGSTGGYFGKAGSIAGPVAAAAAGYTELIKATETATRTINTLGNQSLTTAQKMVAVTEQFVPGAKQLREFFEAVSGTTEKLRMNEIKFADLTLQMQLRMQTEGRMFEYRREQAAATAQATGMGSTPYAAFGQHDRSTVSGRIEYEDSMAKMQAQDEGVRARRRLAAARDDMNKASSFRQERFTAWSNAEINRDRLGVVDGFEGGRLKFKSQFSGGSSPLTRLQRDEDGGKRDKAGMDTALRDYQAANQEYMNTTKQYEQSITQEKEKQLKFLQAQSDVRKTDIAELKQEAAALERRENRMSEGQRRLGGLMEGELMIAENTMDMIRKNGLQNVNSQQLDWARKIAPREIETMLEARGAERAKRLAEKGYMDYEKDYEGGRATLQDVRTQRDKVQADVRVQIDLDEKTLAKDIAQALGPFLNSLRDLTAKLAEAELTQSRAGRQISFNLQF
jgi:hypothetical protein